MVRITSSLLLAAVATSVWAGDAPKCNSDKQCPEKFPCCSQYGECGTGGYCLGGCDPLSSFSVDSCTPEPVCKSTTYKWDNLDNAGLNTKYLGDASKTDWTYSGFPEVKDGNLYINMPKNSVGTLFANNHYVWYGKISAKIKSSRGAGVVTGFIFLSDSKDEIDLEFVGSDLQNVQTNYYYQGILDYENGDKHPVDNTYADWHEYEIDWKPETITWSVDGKEVRTLKRDETWNEKTKRYDYPQTPSRMQLSLWPAGQASNAEGTKEWAGGEIDWDHEDIKKHGKYSAAFGPITVECYDPPKDADIQGDKAYIFTDDSGNESSIRMTNNNTVLASLGATGLDMDAGAKSPSPSGSSPASSSPTNTVPENHGGSGNEPGSNKGGSSGSDSGSDSSNDGDSSSGSDSGFSQDGSDGSSDSGSGTNGSSGAASQNERVLRGSFFAVLVAVVVMITL
ncbi:concanavalin A-like lectin/glucanase domain-containing protein [Aspergillus taichungensis]|uniref:Crh-like protein n=1 Tax=Aspergillus taichungensis TaxID=482145 RepID=A0A2J5I8A3_9EURO|nr:concanavalin A-like lectin/glucanase domain-containing protein [Aspergillus taichungensis]